MITITVRGYDVWGNAEDGYDVNNADIIDSITVDSFNLDEFDWEDHLLGRELSFDCKLDGHYENTTEEPDGTVYHDFEIEDAEDGKPLCQITVTISA